ncbi:MAG: outer membrane beta-barrel protein, partial [Limisphaerales bacterium]
VKNSGRGTILQLTTDGQGRYRAPDLGIGDYEVQAAKSGFSTVVHKNINLTVGAQTIVDFSLPVGQSQQTVTVEAEVSQVETTSATLGSLVNQVQMRELPLNGRNFEQLILLAPGVTSVTTNNHQPFSGAANTYSISGARPEGQALLLDDADIQTFWNQGSGAGILGTSLGVEAIGEFQTLTNTYSAQFGGAGAVVNAVSKSGTNNFHGSAFEFLRNSALDARNFFDGPSVPPFRRNQFGGSVGGPVKKDKAFFFVNYEGLRQSLTQTQIANVPDVNARQGYLPCAVATTKFTCNQATGLAFVGLAPGVAPVLALYPATTVAGNGGVTTIATTGAQVGHENYVLSRFDYNLSEKDSVFARYVSDSADLVTGYNAAATAIPLWPASYTTHNQFATVEERHIFSPAIINVAHASFSRPATIGAPVGSTPPLQLFPGTGRMDAEVTVTGLSNIGQDAPHLPLNLVQNKFEGEDDVFVTRGAHSIKIGFLIRRIQSNTNAPLDQGGVYAFSGLLNMLQALPTTFTAMVPGVNDAWRYFRSIEMLPYFQDDWKVTKRLTLNLGLRYDFSTNPVCLNGLCNEILNAPYSKGFSNIYHVFTNNPSTKNFDPRFGFAYDPFSDHKTSIRGGFGIFHDMYEARTYANPFWNAPPSTQLQQQNGGFPVPFTSSSVPPTPTNTVTAPISSTPYLMEYNLNVQREILPSTILTVGYVGSRGVHLIIGPYINYPTPFVNSNGQLQFSTLSSAGRITMNQFLNPQFGTITSFAPAALSRYNSLQTSLNRRFSHNVQAQVLYTWSRCIDNGSGTFNFENTVVGAVVSNPLNYAVDKGRCGFDINQSLRVDGLYALPFRGNRLVEGWQISGIFTASDGPPFSVTDGFNQSGLNNNIRPNIVPACKASVGTVNEWFNPACFAIQPVGTIGNEGRNTLTLPGVTNFDVALLKNTKIPKISENFDVQFRAEFFNVFN